MLFDIIFPSISCYTNIVLQFDPAVQRFMSMRATRFDHFKPTPRSSLLGIVMIAVPIFGYGWWMKTSRVSTVMDELDFC